jgi:hypothetical protein
LGPSGFQKWLKLLERHEDFVKKYPHLLPEEEEQGKKAEAGEETESSAPQDNSSPKGEPQPAYKPEEIEGGEETENKTRDV